MEQEQVLRKALEIACKTVAELGWVEVVCDKCELLQGTPDCGSPECIAALTAHYIERAKEGLGV
jgi:hypothetical protein